MFHNIPDPILQRMRFLEEIDRRDRQDGTPRLQRLRQIPPETGKFLALLAANTPNGEWLEIGTSAGYSTLWLTLACRNCKTHLTTFEILDEKIALAQETFRLAQVEDCVQLISGDARLHLPNYKEISFCFLDAEKTVYADCYEAVIPNLLPGGIFAADNAINHQETLQPVLKRAQTDPRVDALVVPVGKGVLVCRKI